MISVLYAYSSRRGALRTVHPMPKKIHHDTRTDLEVYNPALGRHAFVSPRGGRASGQW